MKTLEYYKNLEYTERIDPDPEGGFVASIPDLPGCLAYGETKIKALNSLKHSKDLWLESVYKSHGEAPEPRPLQQYSGKFLLRVPKYLHQRLDESAQEESTSLNQYIVSLLSERDTLNRVTQVLQKSITQKSASVATASASWDRSASWDQWLLYKSQSIKTLQGALVEETAYAAEVAPSLETFEAFRSHAIGRMNPELVDVRE